MKVLAWCFNTTGDGPDLLDIVDQRIDEYEARRQAGTTIGGEAWEHYAYELTRDILRITGGPHAASEPEDRQDGPEAA